MATNDQIFDSDGHVYEVESDLLDYFDPPYRGRQELLRESLFPTDGWHRTSQGIARGQRGLVSGPITAQRWLDALDAFGSEGVALYTTKGLAIGMVKNPEWALALTKAYNNWLYDRFLKVSPRLKGMALIPIQSPPDAVEELKRAVTQLGMVGAILPGGGLRPLLGDPFYYPLYEAAQELDVGLTVHAGAPLPGLDDLFQRWSDMRVLTHSVAQMTQLTHMMFSGVFDRFPRLRVAFLEAGVAWVLCILERLQREYKHWGVLLSDIRKEPKEHLKSGRLLFEAELDDEMLDYAVKVLGDRSLVFTSDFPHFVRPEQVSENLSRFKKRSDMSEEIKARILGENGRRFYKINPVPTI